MTTTTTTTRTRPSRGTGTSAGRRQAPRTRADQDRLARAGRPVRSALLRVPFVLALIAVLAVGVGGTLYLNTKIDESGIRTQQAKDSAAQLRLEIEALNQSIAELDATPRIAQEARELGLVPVGDAAMLVLNGHGGARVIGTPTPVPPSHAGAGEGGR